MYTVEEEKKREQGETITETKILEFYAGKIK